MLEKIIADETWLEGERRGHAIDPNDPVVRHNVCMVVLRTGADMRAHVMRQLAAENQSRVGELEMPVATLTVTVAA